MRILLIKPKHIGDTLILTPTIRAIKMAYPAAEIWVLVRQGCEGILAGCPDIAKILTLAGVEKSERGRGDVRRQIGVLFQLWRVKFDYVFELGDGHRARLFALLARTRRRCSVKTASPLKPLEARFFEVSRFDAFTAHRIEKDFATVSEFLPLPPPIPPLIFEPARMQPWPDGEGLTDYAVLQIGTRQGFKRWPREHWLAVGKELLDGFPRLVITCGPAPSELEDAGWLRAQLGPSVLSTDGRTSWPQVAWLLRRAKIYVGLNTAAMHLAAAGGCPVVALFGPTLEDHWYPWRVPYRIVNPPGYRAPDDPVQRHAAARRRTMDEIQPRQVAAACRALLAEVAQVRS